MKKWTTSWRPRRDAIPDPADIVLFDTDVVSYVLRGDSRAAIFDHVITGNRIAVSFQTVAELYRGAFERDWGEVRIVRLQRWLEQVIVVPYSPAMAIGWARIMADARQAGRVISAQDAWIAATAIVHGRRLATNNRKDFEGIRGLILAEPRTGG